ncbi:MAG: hypothetical protein I3J02_08815 [Prevotella sp.]|nr:hypothetical protein [Prevotella sp.]
MKKRITNCLLAVALLSATAGTFVSCKDYEGDSVWNERIAENSNLIEALTQQVNSLKTAQANCQAQCKKTQDSLAQITSINEAAIAKNAGDIASLSTTVTANGKTIAQNSQDIADLQARVAKLEEADQLITNTLAQNYATVNTRIDSVVAAINEVNKTALKALALAQQDSVEIDALQSAVIGLQSDVKDLYLKAMADSTLAANALQLADSATTLATANLESINNLTDTVSAIKVTLAQLEDAYKAADAQLQSQIDSLDERVTALENAYKLQVTSITVNGAESPVIGYFAAPTGDVRSTILAAYYGDAAQFRFPTSTSSFYADADATMLTDADLEVTGNTSAAIEGGTTIVSDDGAEGNAGTLWLTLNPTSVDLTGKSFSLVNSQGEASLITLSPVVSSDKVLSFGYTRAGSDNGFYETKATVSAANAKALKPNISRADLQAVAQELSNFWNSNPVNLTKAVSLLYNNMNNVLPALALKTTWDNNGTAQSVLSQYSVAATAVKPLSYGFLKNLNVKFPTLTALEQISTSTVTPSGTSFTLVAEDGTSYTMTSTELNDYIDEQNSKFTSVAKQIIDRANSYISKYNNFANRLSSIINRFNQRIQPVIFIQKDNEFYQLSNAPYGTDALQSGAVLNLTSYTAELLAPAYKKWVAVTNVWNNTDDAVKAMSGTAVASAQSGDATLKSALQDANGGTNMNKVVYGSISNATLGTLQSGKVYEISFSAVDFAGKVAARKFYFRGM